MIFKKTLITVFTLFISAAGCAQDVQETSQSTEEQQVNAKELFDWVSMEEAQKLAGEHDKKVLVYINATWCGYCKKMEREVFTVEKVQEKTEEHFYPVWIDIDVEDEFLTFRGRELSQREFAGAMRATGTPTFIFIDSEGEIIAGQPGFIPEEMYVQILDYVGTNAYQDQSFSEFAEMQSDS
ncbi:thioredoxin family protein [Gracilimonas sp.]|uniref:thioredoxin family protein n=1 Tax=Gracilimonas sp. TaxID=1974203 RepID=UPI00287202E0|nr:thioredoxin fold domain-containing protein [Gracilimonas sp.]